MARSRISINLIEMENTTYDIFYQDTKTIVSKVDIVGFKVILLTQPLVPTLAKRIKVLMFMFANDEFYEYAAVCKKYLEKL